MKIEKWMWVVGILVAVFLCLSGWLFSRLISTPNPIAHIPTAGLTLLPYQTLTPSLVPIYNSTQSQGAESTVIVNQISPGMFVQISGTGGAGLHLRSGPGTEFSSNFVGMENEVFEVIGGPEDANGFTWWFLSAPYDETRNGWAVENYLSIIH